MSYDAVLLDLDGTLVNSIPDLADATNAMRVELGLPQLPLDVIATYVGKGAENLVKRALSNHIDPTPDDLLAQGRRLFKQHYRALNGAKSAVYTGVVEGLSHWRDAGLKMAVVTNKPAEFTHALLASCGLSSFFDEVISGDTCAEKKPHPMPLLHACHLLGVAPERVVMVGDSANDAIAAQAANITMLAVPYGYNEGQDVHNLKVDAIVDDVYSAALWVTNRLESVKQAKQTGQ